jgi:predicted PurR-regulated permease PerM
MESKGINKMGAIITSLLLLVSFIAIIVYLLFVQINEFSAWEFREKLLEALNQISVLSQSDLKQLQKNKLHFKTPLIIPVQAYFIQALRVPVFLLIIPVLSALILYYRQLLAKVLYQLFPLVKEIIHEILIETIRAYYNFIKGMLIVYLIVGLLNSIGLLIVGVPHPFMFGFIALYFIPYIGIMISSLLPIAVSWITFNSIWYPLGVVLVFSIVQALEAYVIFPFAVGRRLKLMHWL